MEKVGTEMIYVGIDPGVDGALALIEECDHGSGAATGHVPIIKNGGKKEYNIRGMSDSLVFAGPNSAFVVLEKQQAYPGQGVVSTFKIGRGYGIWEGILSALNLDYVTVHPRVWQKEIIPGVKGETKLRSVAMAKKLFPDVSLRLSSRHKSDHHGLSDALLLAEWGRRNYKFIQATKEKP